MASTKARAGERTRSPRQKNHTIHAVNIAQSIKIIMEISLRRLAVLEENIVLVVISEQNLKEIAKIINSGADISVPTVKSRGRAISVSSGDIKPSA